MTNRNEYKNELATNWDQFAHYNAQSTRALHALLPGLNGKSVLDIGCGSGKDFEVYRMKGASKVVGIDVSEDMLMQAAKRNAADELIPADMSQLFAANQTYDVVVSKWALQAVADYHQVNENLRRLTHVGAVIIILIVHPLRQFLKKSRGQRDYFTQEVIPSQLFDGQVTVYEPTHTFADIFSPTFLQHFSLEVLQEGSEIGCSKVDGDVYPQYLLYKAVRR